MVVLVAGLGLGGCTLVPTDVAPRVVPARDVPSGLLSGKPINHAAAVTVTFLDASGATRDTQVSVEAPVTVRVIVSALARPSSPYRSAVPTDLTVLRAIIHGTRADITVATGISALPRAMRRQALTQIGRSLHTLYGTTRLNVSDAATGVAYRWVGISGR